MSPVVKPVACPKGHTLGFRLESNGKKRPQWRCRECESIRERQYRESKREIHRLAAAAWRQRNREKSRAHDIVNHEIRKGRLIRPDRCDHCDKSGPVQASHNDYLRPLEVEWLCPMCHATKDATMRRERKAA